MLVILRKILHPLLFLLAIHASGQTDTTLYYFNDDLEEVAPKKASYTAKGWIENGKIGMIYYEKATGIALTLAYYLDKERKIKDGLFINYDEKGKEAIKGVFVQGEEDGYWRYWNNGYLTDSVLFDKGKDLVRTSYSFYDNGLLKSRISNDSRNKMTEIMLIDQNGNLERLTKWVQGTGDQIYYYPNGKIRSVEHYKDKLLASTDFFHVDGTPMTKKESKKEKEQQAENSWKQTQANSPLFPGGEVGFRVQFQKHFRTPAGVDNDIRNAVLIRILFYLDKHGRATNITLVESPTIELNRAVENAFKNMPSWDMKGATSFGPIQYTISLTSN